MSVLYLGSRDIASIIRLNGLKKTIHDVMEMVKVDYLNWAKFEKVPRIASYSTGGVIELMPVSDETLYSFKYVNGHPKNEKYKLPTVMAYGCLSEVKTGIPLFLCDLTVLTAVRTAAASVLAATVLARRDSRTMAVIGNGAQAEFQITAFHHIMGIDNFRLYDIDQGATDKLVRNLSGMKADFVQCRDTREAVATSDIITTITADKCNATILNGSMVNPGVHVNGVGGDSVGKTELSVDLLEKSKVVVQYRDQAVIEGDIQQMPRDFPVTELSDVLLGVKPGRESEEEITVFDSVGIALEDHSALKYMFNQSRILGYGTMIDLIPQITNPKDLYGAIFGDS